MKKVTFPHMGNLYLPARTFFEAMDVEVIVPPPNSKKTLDLGIKYSPEFACLPLKINIGNFIEALEKGANVIVMGGGRGPCRFGYYGQVQSEILKDLGYDFELISLETEIWKTFKRLRKLFGGISIKKIYRAGKLTWMKMQVMDDIHRQVLKARAREEKQGLVDQIYKQFLKELDTTMSIDRINQLGQHYTEKIKETRGSYKRGLQIEIGIVGEIYVVMEPFVNVDLEKKLGQLGVTVSREMYLTNWIRNFLNLSSERKEITTAAAPYLDSFVGGHGQDSVGHTVKYAAGGYDGIIQVAPFTCMPEIVAQSILPETAKQENIHVLSIIFDEHSADAGLITRLEAFVDLIHRQKQEFGGNIKVN